MTAAPGPGDAFDRASWDRRWSRALRGGAHAVAQRPPNAHLLAAVADLRPGRALDAGAGHGAETLWLAARGWQVTAVDFSTTALDHARSQAEAQGPDVAPRIEWIVADLSLAATCALVGWLDSSVEDRIVSIVVRFTPTALTAAKYDETIQTLEKSGEFPPDGLDYHVAFASEGSLRVSEIWDSREQFAAFGERLMPILTAAGIQFSGEPEIFEVHNTIKR